METVVWTGCWPDEGIRVGQGERGQELVQGEEVVVLAVPGAP